MAESYTGEGHKIEILNITYAFVYKIPGFIINFFAVTAKPPFTESILFSRMKRLNQIGGGDVFEFAAAGPKRSKSHKSRKLTAVVHGRD